MSCGEQVEVEETYWGWCSKWYVPYPCRKSRTVMRYRYDMLPWRSRVAPPFKSSYEGCCGALLYKWSFWHLSPFGTGNSAWNQFSAKTIYRSSKLSPHGDCPIGPTAGID